MPEASSADLTDLLTPRHDRIDLARLRRMVEGETQRYVERTPRSRALADRAMKHMIGGVMSTWHADWHLPHPLYVARSQGNRVWDVDSNEYVDFNFGDTPDMFGHAPDNEVTRSLSDFIRNQGIATLLPNEDAIVASEILADRFGLKYWYTALSASDANRFCIKIARMLTGRLLPQPPRDAFDGALGIGLGGYFEFVHLRALNRGFMIIPYYNMFLSSPYTSVEDVDAWIECFEDLVADMLGTA